VLSKRPIDTDEILAVDMRETGKMDCTMGLDDIPLLMAQCTPDSFMYVLIDLIGIARERERERESNRDGRNAGHFFNKHLYCHSR
jgi:hypothetical protein